MPHTKSLGICIGASSVSAVTLIKDKEGIKITSSENIPHNGNPKKLLERLLENGAPDKIAVTGRKFRKLCNLTSISEAEAVEYALANIDQKPDIVISAGGENFVVYVLDDKQKISKVLTGNKCASGTGEFFLQQIKRMNLELEEAIPLAEKGTPYNISGRCSVFCKSDCTHALNKGVPKPDVVAGLSRMMAQKIVELTSRVNHKNAMVIGGTSKNLGMVRFLKEQFEDITIPAEAPFFEAYGAALFALKSDTIKLNKAKVFKEEHTNFTFHKPIKDYIGQVEFKTITRAIANENDECILGLDVGSTTTKAVLLRAADNSIVASEYLRTNGDPVKAAIECYSSLNNQIKNNIKITGLGVTGSGRHIAGLHALTDGVINEIIAHAAATVFFDKDVDTIFEIGGQDAKYTHITSGIASDYAMNEACSAGTGSFLEEAAKESLGIDYLKIGDIALHSDRPPNFNDQCSAFISSDIKNALHEGLSREDIVAGLVYSICLNYTNRVKGNRPVGKKVFMQGGVCYNKAVPAAMAALTGKKIIVPPEPGLMGAFGVALEIKKRIELNLIEKKGFSLEALINRKVEYDKEFVCAGGKEKCDRKCQISMIRIDGNRFPFGGACNKYYTLTASKEYDSEELNLVALRQKLVYEKYAPQVKLSDGAPTIGISKSFLTNTYYPLYYNFFTSLGFKIILGQEPKTSGMDKKEAAFCFPVELAHGFFQDLIDKKPDYIFMPHITEIEVPGEKFFKKTCVLLQSEFYYLKTAFKDEIKDVKFLTPVLNFSAGYESAEPEFVKIAEQLGKTNRQASEAYKSACAKLREMFAEFLNIGRITLKKLEADPDRFAIVLFGRAYNSFTKEANLGIPQKFTSRGVALIPHDFLSSENEESYPHMYWGTGQQILKAARLVKENKQLFGTYITNFSCGPDSFLIGYFRNIMKSKPSLTLELDSHSADAGVNTRIEAALDIIKSYIEINKANIAEEEKEIEFQPLQVKDSYTIIDSDNNELSLTDKNVKMLIPSMGEIATQAFAAAFRHIGVNSEPLQVYDFNTLILGRGNATCKECLPLILGTGSFIEYYNHRKNPDEKTLYFMPKGDGPCRFGQYHIFQQDVIKKRRMRNMGVYSLSDDDSYGGLSNKFTLRGWTAITISDVAKNMYNALAALAVNKEAAKKIFYCEWQNIIESLEKDDTNLLYKKLEKFSFELSKIKLTESFEDAKKIVLIGEIFVRHDEYSRIDLIERLSEKGFVVNTAPIGEYVYYSNHLAKLNHPEVSSKTVEKIKFSLREYFQQNVEKKVKRILAKSHLTDYELIDIKDILKNADGLIRPELEGEAILTVGSGLKESQNNVCGVVSIGPFGCMPSRVAESILNVEMSAETKAETSAFPFLALETDGNIFPQIIQSKIEIFMLQAERLHEKMRKEGMPAKQRKGFAALIEELILSRKPDKSKADYDEALLEQ